jgi:hypothetical protein
MTFVGGMGCYGISLENIVEEYKPKVNRMLTRTALDEFWTRCQVLFRALCEHTGKGLLKFGAPDIELAAKGLGRMSSCQ